MNESISDGNKRIYDAVTVETSTKIFSIRIYALEMISDIGIHTYIHT